LPETIESSSIALVETTGKTKATCEFTLLACRDGRPCFSIMQIYRVAAASLLLLTVAAGFVPNRANTSSRSGTIGGSLYDNDIDWDSDLFSQINQREQAQAQKGNIKEDAGIEASKLDDSSWSMDGSTPSNVQDVREQMKQSWTGEESKKDGTQSEKNQKLKVDWVPNFRNVDEDEPWFTG
ncbi:hypothetical protein THAOC_20202, partial [Thalassiosira oceanica]